MAEPFEHYFCWVRVVRVTTAAEPAPVTLVEDFSNQKLIDLFARLEILNGPRPPNNVVAKQTEATQTQASNRSVLGVWTGVEETFGREGADTVFDYGPAFLDAESARCWITTGPGKIWDAAALNRFLFTFTRVSPGRVAPRGKAP